MSTQQGNYLEDFSPGQIFNHPIPRTISEGDASLYLALLGNRNPLHCSLKTAKAVNFKSIPIDDLLLFHIAFGRTVNDISLNAVANLGYANIQFKNPAFVGDTISSQTKIIGLKENSNKSTGIVYVQSAAFNQNGTELLSWIRWVMVPKKDAGAKIIEQLPDALPDRADLSIIERKGMVFSNLDLADTGSNKLFEDYQIGDVFNHSSGITIDETDHTLATKLYQNNAKLHFDAHMMKDTPFKRRLIYGGHIISLCRSLSFDGLENAIQILGVNNGTHCNPTFAGDTIYCRTEITDKLELSQLNDAGVLRVRQYGFKNKPGAKISEIATEKNGKKIYNSNTVLDIDYFVLIPRRK